MTRFSLVAALGLIATPAFAEDLRPAPDYYVEALFSLTMAEALATSCRTVGMDLLAAGAATTGLTEQLAEDGFDTEQPFAQMIDPAPAIRDLQADFLVKHPGLNEPTEEIVCNVALAEMAEETVIGRLLFDGTQLQNPEPTPEGQGD